jgi:signal transduction histidine kinase
MCEHLVVAQRRIEQETAARIATLEQLRHTDRLTTVGKLASGVAHELGTPVNVVSARASMIASGAASRQESIEYARIIAEATTRMAKIIRQLLAFARRKPAVRAAHDVSRLARDTVEFLRPLAAKRNIDLVLRCDKSEAIALVDGGELQQALTNLVINAIQAMSHAGTIEISVDEDVEVPPVRDSAVPYLRVRVRDEGEGISREHLAHIFEPFFTTKDVGEGTGLGLSVAHGIVEEHAGWITVETNASTGSVFTMYLPIGEHRDS